MFFLFLAINQHDSPAWKPMEETSIRCGLRELTPKKWKLERLPVSAAPTCPDVDFS